MQASIKAADMPVFKLFLLLLICTLPLILCQDNSSVTIIVEGGVTMAETDDNFICATIDWWPPEKCSNNQCPWGNASVLNMDLNHPYLSAAMKAFKSLRVRVGGTLQDSLVYEVGSLKPPCPPFTSVPSGLFGFSSGCLSMQKWDQLNNLFQKTGVTATFGLNALQGRQEGSKGVWFGAWNSSNARDLIEYTLLKGYPVDSWEFGNELSGQGVGASVGAQQYATDLISLKAILDELYRNSTSKPLLVAPGGFFNDPQWFSQFLDSSGTNVLNVLTHHVYNLGGGDDPHIADRITNPDYLSGFANTFRDVQLTIQRHVPWSSAWVGEGGGVYGSGSPLVSNTFLNSFWYLDQLGMASKYNTKVYCRQTLIGGNYGLLDTQTFIPNPDYYSALLWNQLMGKGVLNIVITGSPFLKAYAHCNKAKSGVSLLLINLSKSTAFNVTVLNNLNLVGSSERQISKDGTFMRGLKQTVSWVGQKGSDTPMSREEYHLTGKDGNYLSRTVLLNGSPLQLTNDGGVPVLSPAYAAVGAPIAVAPMSIAFVVFPNFEARACV